MRHSNGFGHGRVTRMVRVADPVASDYCFRRVSRGGEAYLPETVVLKLNGGLGTSMGLDKAKSLLPVKGDDCFLDLTAKQVGC